MKKLVVLLIIFCGGFSNIYSQPVLSFKDRLRLKKQATEKIETVSNSLEIYVRKDIDSNTIQRNKELIFEQFDNPPEDIVELSIRNQITHIILYTITRRLPIYLRNLRRLNYVKIKLRWENIKIYGLDKDTVNLDPMHTVVTQKFIGRKKIENTASIVL